MKSSRSNKDQLPENFCFESYGVPVRVESSDPRLLQDARSKARDILVGNFKIIESADTPHVYRLERQKRAYVLIKDGRTLRHGTLKKRFFLYFDTLLRITVAEFAVGRVFLHAGVVGWKGKAIIIPGDSFSGKTSLIVELVKRGAEYYSDEYAVFDEKGFVHSFPRKLEIRSRPNGHEHIEITRLTADELGGKKGRGPIPVGSILITKFEEDAVWKPQFLTPGQGILEMLSQTIPIRYAPEFSLEVLKKVTANAIIVKSFRFDAERFADIFLDFVDNKAF